MKKVLVVVMLLCLSCGIAFAKAFDNFNYVLNNTASKSDAKRYLNHLANDMGAIITSGGFGVSASLGLLGVDLHAKLNANRVSNEIMKASGVSDVYTPFISAAVGLPYDIDVLAKYGYFDDTNIVGLGLRYLVYEGYSVFVPSVSVQGMYSYANTSSGNNKLDTSNIALGTIATFNVPFVTPYVGIGWDTTKVTAKSSQWDGLEGTANSFGYYAGVAVSVIGINGTLGIGWYDDDITYTFGLSLSI